jgi:DNA mismatch repair protein MutS2
MSHVESDSPLPHYDPDAFRPYAPIMREIFAVLADDYSGPYGVDLPNKTLEDLRWREVQKRLAHGCVGEEARLAAERLPLLQHRESVLRRLHEVEEAKRLVTSDGAPPLDGLTSIGATLDHAARGGVLDGQALLAVARCATVATNTQGYFQTRGLPAPLLAHVAADLGEVPHVAAAIGKAFDDDGKLSDQASPDLGPLRRKVHGFSGRLRSTIEGYLKDPQFADFLQDDFWTLREERYVLPVRAGEKGNVRGIVHGTSASGQTIFIEPTALVEMNNDLRIAQMEVEAEERRILARLTQLVAQHGRQLEANIDLLAYIDLTVAMGKMAADLRATRPEVSKDRRLELRNARHPILVWSYREAGGRFEVVPNDILVGGGGDDEDNKGAGLVISGPNTGGKTVTLKTMGLCALMVRAGLLIPADPGSVVPLFDAVYTDVGDEQSIEKNLSTFSGHLVNIANFLPRVGSGSLVLLDELFAGTDPAQGSSLAIALLEDIADRGATVAVTTHLDSLKTLALRSETFVNGSMGFDVSTLAPTYKLSLGLPGSSYAIRIARKLGLPESILSRANQLSAGLGQADVEQILRGLDQQREKLDLELKRAREIKADAAKTRSRLEQKLKALEDRDRQVIGEETRRVLDALAEARDRVKTRIRELQSRDAPETVTHELLDRVRSELNEIERRVDATAGKAAPNKRERLSIKDVEVGDEAWILTFKRRGEILEIESGRGKVAVQVGGVRATVDDTDLFKLDDSERAKQPRAPKPKNTIVGVASDSPLPPPNASNSLDLRGMRADEAIERLELTLDAMYHAEEPGLYVIHGHGTGALKRAVRQQLPSLRYVGQFRPGEHGEGGDGVTVVMLK